jgi:hypothetical protein
VRSAVFLALVLALGCSPPPVRRNVSESAVIVDAALDSLTSVGRALQIEDQMIAAQFEMGLQRILCTQTNPAVFHLAAEGAGSDAFGSFTVVVGLIGDPELEPCEGEGELLVQAASHDADGNYLIRGPALVDGLRMEARVPIGRLGGAFAVLPEWWTITASGGETVIGPSAILDELRTGEARARWYASEAFFAPGPSGGTMLDELVRVGAQPDVDVDFDGLETFRDTDGDGRIDECTDGTGDLPADAGVPDPVTGPDCPSLPDFQDAYELILNMRLAPIVLRDPPPI